MNKTLVNKKLVFRIGIAALLIVAGVVYEVILPNHYASDYNKKVRASVAELQPVLDKAGAIHTNPIFNVHDTTVSQNILSLNKISATITQAQTGLQNFKKTAGSLHKLQLSGYIGSYRKARTTEMRAEAVARDATNRLNNLQTLVTYFVNSSKIDAQTLSQITDVSKPDLASSAISAGMKVNGQALYTSAKAYAALKKPVIVQDINRQIVDETNAMATAMIAESKAIDVGDQGGFDVGLQNYNVAVEQIDNTNKDAINRVSSTSNFMKPIKELPTLTKQLDL